MKLPQEEFYRHSAPVRAWHWINALCILMLLGSGLNIFNAHPRLYWRMYGADTDSSFFSLSARQTPNGLRGITQIGKHQFDTTGVLGASTSSGEVVERGWPDWLTIPSFQDLADARHWHFLFAWILALNLIVYLMWSLTQRHLQKDVIPNLRDLREIPLSFWEHIRFKNPSGEAARRYNPLQKLAYLGVLTTITLMALSGMTMSPALDAVFPWLLDLFGGRQSARSIHFICAGLIVLFVAIHLAEVLLAGPVNEIRSMLTGRYVVPQERDS
jgi:thiosulfate reductase cytochrome b subunit